MATAIELRGDFSGDDLRGLRGPAGTRSRCGGCWRWPAIYDGATRTEAARIGSVTLQIVRDWVLRFNAEGPDGLIDRKPPGKTPTLTEDQRAALGEAIEAGPEPWRDGVVRWRLIDLVQWLWEEFRVSVSGATVVRECGRSATASSRRGRGMTRRIRRRHRSFQKSLPSSSAEVQTRILPSA